MANEEHEQISCSGMSLTLYREVAAHLQQVEGVKTELIPQQSKQFDYSQSQIGGLWIKYPENLEPRNKERMEEILAYYAQHHGQWLRLK